MRMRVYRHLNRCICPQTATIWQTPLDHPRQADGARPNFSSGLRPAIDKELCRKRGRPLPAAVKTRLRRLAYLRAHGLDPWYLRDHWVFRATYIDRTRWLFQVKRALLWSPLASLFSASKTYATRDSKAARERIRIRWTFYCGMKTLHRLSSKVSKSFGLRLQPFICAPSLPRSDYFYHARSPAASVSRVSYRDNSYCDIVTRTIASEIMRY